MDWSDTEKEIDNLTERLNRDLSDVMSCCQRDTESRDSLWLRGDTADLVENEFRRFKDTASSETVPEGIRKKYEVAEKLYEEFEKAYKSLCVRINDYQTELLHWYTVKLNRFDRIYSDLMNGYDADDSDFEEARLISRKADEDLKYAECYSDILISAIDAAQSKCNDVAGRRYSSSCSKGLDYDRTETGYEVIWSENEKVGRVDVPAMFRGLPVTQIGMNAFTGSREITSVYLADSVKEIKDYAFDGCTALKYANLGSSLTRIDSSAFNRCSALWMIIIPDSVTYIGDYAFNCCSFLSKLTLPGTSFKVGINVFWRCNSLEKVVNPLRRRFVLPRHVL